MLIDPADTVLLLPAQTRYEMVGGVTETSTERRVIFSPEVPGPAAGAGVAGVPHLRRDRRPGPARAGRRGPVSRAPPRSAPRSPGPSPVYDGIQNLQGVRRLVPVRRPAPVRRLALPDRRRAGPTSRSSRCPAAAPPGGRLPGGDPARQAVQQHGARAQGPAHRRGPRGGADQPGRRRPAGPCRRRPRWCSPAPADRCPGRVLRAPVTPGNLQVHWPEGEVLIDRTRRSPQARMPDYNAVVQLERVAERAAGRRPRWAEHGGASRRDQPRAGAGGRRRPGR